jgi:hypothetical protein
MIGADTLVSKTLVSCEAVIASLKQMGGRCRPPVGRHAPCSLFWIGTCLRDLPRRRLGAHTTKCDFGAG